MKSFNFNPNYVVYKDGRVFSTLSNKFLKHQVTNGTSFVSIRIPGRSSRTISVNQLVYHVHVNTLSFSDDSYVVVPKDGDPTNHNHDNLILRSRTQQIEDNIYSKNLEYREGRKVTSSPLGGYEQEITRLVRDESMTRVSIAKIFNVSSMAVKRAIDRYDHYHKVLKDVPPYEVVTNKNNKYGVILSGIEVVPFIYNNKYSAVDELIRFEKMNAKDPFLHRVLSDQEIRALHSHLTQKSIMYLPGRGTLNLLLKCRSRIQFDDFYESYMKFNDTDEELRKVIRSNSTLSKRVSLWY